MYELGECQRAKSRVATPRDWREGSSVSKGRKPPDPCWRDTAPVTRSQSTKLKRRQRFVKESEVLLRAKSVSCVWCSDLLRHFSNCEPRHLSATYSVHIRLLDTSQELHTFGFPLTSTPFGRPCRLRLSKTSPPAEATCLSIPEPPSWDTIVFAISTRTCL